jgi:hypothetical protein
LKSIGERAGRLTSVFGGLGTAIAGYFTFSALKAGLTSALSAFSESEAAVVKLSNTFQTLGGDGAAAAKKWTAYAESMMAVTGMDDEVILGLVTTAKTMGVVNEQIEFATRGALGLSRAFGMDVNTAMKMTALAMEGQYETLGRMIPAVRSASSEYEKAVIVVKAMEVGYSNLQKESETLSGATDRIKVAFGEAMEEIGESIAGKAGVVGALDKLKAKLESLSDSGALKEFGENAGRVLGGIAKTVETVVNGWTMLTQLFKTGASFLGTFAANVVNPPKGAGSMMDIIGAAAQETRDNAAPIIGTEEAKIAQIEKETVRIKERAAFLRKENEDQEQAKKIILDKAKIADEAIELEKTKKNQLASMEKGYELELRMLQAKGDEEAVKNLNRRMELKKAANEAEKKMLLEIYAMEDARSTKSAQPKMTDEQLRTERYKAAFWSSGTEFKSEPSKFVGFESNASPAPSGLSSGLSAPPSILGGETLESSLSNTLGENSQVGNTALKSKLKQDTIHTVLIETKEILKELLDLSNERMGGVKT